MEFTMQEEREYLAFDAWCCERGIDDPTEADREKFYAEAEAERD